MPTDRWRDRFAWAPQADERPSPDRLEVRTEITVPASIDDTFAFFADAANLERLTPPWLRFTIQTPLPIVMRPGTMIDYRLAVHGVPIAWRSRIDVWEPGRRFVDRQVRGPYRWWRHEHLFEPVPSGTRMIDIVEYQPRLRWLTSGLVRRDVERIFAFRRDTLTRLFALTPVSNAAAATSASMATGSIGSRR